MHQRSATTMSNNACPDQSNDFVVPMKHHPQQTAPRTHKRKLRI
jgi:hypothetical protein